MTAVLALDTHLPGPAVGHRLLPIDHSLRLRPVRADGGLTTGPRGTQTCRGDEKYKIFPILLNTCVRGAVGLIRAVVTIDIPVTEERQLQTFPRAALPLPLTTTALCGCCWRGAGAAGRGVGRLPGSLEEHPEPVIVVVGVSEESDGDPLRLEEDVGRDLVPAEVPPLASGEVLDGEMVVAVSVPSLQPERITEGEFDWLRAFVGDGPSQDYQLLPTSPGVLTYTPGLRDTPRRRSLDSQCSGCQWWRSGDVTIN